jgi:hypothetical protein
MVLLDMEEVGRDIAEGLCPEDAEDGREIIRGL